MKALMVWYYKDVRLNLAFKLLLKCSQTLFSFILMVAV